ncbi:MAG: bile acid:sodium symporter, partial [Candidatus Marinimicrobia bacterium]|nr:bile acid:sodium symporter [Candidatus Neomarinimicrobiota bacterium]
MIIDIILPLSLVFIMFSLGLGLTIDDFKNVAKHPKIFAIGLINQMILLPLVAFGIIALFGITKEMAVGLMILASCPGGVTSNIITKLAKGDTALSISYTAVVSIVT